MKNSVHALTVAAAAFVLLTAGTAQAAAPERFDGQDASTKQRWSYADRNVTVYFGVKNLKREVTMQSKHLEFRLDADLVTAPQDRTFEVPAETSTDDGRTWKKSGNTGLGCRAETADSGESVQVVTCTNTNTTRWEKNSILRWGVPATMTPAQTGNDITLGNGEMAFEAAVGWGATQDFVTPRMTARADSNE
ncbi:hypothetical protein SXANM310S_03782 [Streptomyces xanthochromogenes]